MIPSRKSTLSDLAYYEDMRYGGVSQGVIGDPRKALVRFPDDILRSTAFLCVEESKGSFTPIGTGFFLTIPAKPGPGTVAHLYLVTARHCIDAMRAEGYPDLYIRVNAEKRFGGRLRTEKLVRPWRYPATKADDVAVMSMPIECVREWAISPLVIPGMALSKDDVEKYGVGVGDEVYAGGLLPQHFGRKRNLPILRAGIISSMPLEKIVPRKPRLPFYAYLAEIRSIGGLSGSPVFMLLSKGLNFRPDPRLSKGKEVGLPVKIVGLIRAHWRKEEFEVGDAELGAQAPPEMSQDPDLINTGIAIVTPIEGALKIIETNKHLIREREELDQAALGKNHFVED